MPAGTSVWELGVEKNPQKKAEEDFDKRTKDPLGLDREKTTFVFVTLRKWQKKEEWRRAKQDLGIWKEVRVYDSATLEEWLEQAPAVNAWLAGILGKRPPGLTDLDEYWANLQAMTDPSLKPEVFLASREEAGRRTKELARWPAGTMVIRGKVAGRGNRLRGRIQPRPISGGMVWRAGLDHGDPRRVAKRLGCGGRQGYSSLRIRPSRSSRSWLRRRCARGIAYWSPPTRRPESECRASRLPRAYRHDLEKALVSSGLDEERARRHARKAGGSLTVLKRLLGRLSGDDSARVEPTGGSRGACADVAGWKLG